MANPPTKGSVRVTSKRAGGLAPEPDELVIAVDRENPVLGNPHVLRDHRDLEERRRVIARYQTDLEADFAVSGPKYRACAAIAVQVKAGAKVALNCWCKQRRKEIPCHGDLLRTRIMALAGLSDLPEQSSFLLSGET